MKIPNVFLLIEYLVSNSYKILVLFIILVLVIVGGVYGYGSVSDYFAQQSFISAFQTTYNTPQSLAKAQASGLQAYFSLTPEQVASMTQSQKDSKAEALSQNLVVYTLKFHVETDTSLSKPCIMLDKFVYDGTFNTFKLNPKWQSFYGFSIFGSTPYNVSYHSDIFLAGNFNFPLEYYEDYRPNFTVYQGGFVASNIKFKDSMQVVLPDSNGDKIPDDENFVIKVQYSAVPQGQSLSTSNAKVMSIPLTLRNGYLQVAQSGMRCFA